MSEFCKVQTVFKRDPENKYKTLLHGQFSLPEFEYLADNEWVFTEKVDGTNIRVYYSDSGPGLEVDVPHVAIRGRTDKADTPKPLTRSLLGWFDPDDLFEVFGTSKVCFYGEGYGPKIQKGGGRYADEQSFVLFDVMINGWWLTRESVEEIAAQFGLKVVPETGRGTLFDMVERAKKGFESEWGPFPAEGIVARPAVELQTRAGHRVITKIKHKDFV